MRTDLSSVVLTLMLASCGGPNKASDAAVAPPAPTPAAPAPARVASPPDASAAPATAADAESPGGASTTPPPTAADAAVAAPAADAAPASPVAPTPPEPPAAPAAAARFKPFPSGAGPLEARLVAELGAGQPVAILPWPDGLVAMSADGERAATLTPGPVLWALVDDRAHVVWYGLPAKVADGAEEKDELWALDLTLEAPTPRRIASGLVHEAELSVEYRAAKGTKPLESFALGLRYGARVDVVLEPGHPRLEASGGVYAELGLVDGDANAQAVGLAQPDAPTAAFLEALIARGQEPRAPRPAPKDAAPKPPARISVPDACEDKALCGVTERFGGSPYWLVTVAHSCGDACYQTRQLYDPKAKRYVAITSPDGTSDTPFDGDAEAIVSAVVAADGHAFISHATLYRFGAAPRAPEGGDYQPTGGGWLGGQDFVW